jgi:uncharacterized membrane protein
MDQLDNLRSTRERVLQSLWFEGLGLLIVAPLYGWVAGAGMAESFALIAAVSLAVMTWAALFNTVFDAVEWRCTSRLASNRPHAMRLVHAVLFEISATVVSCPVIVWITGMGWLEALLADIALTLVYTVYGYAFHWFFDHLRPVRRAST